MDLLFNQQRLPACSLSQANCVEQAQTAARKESSCGNLQPQRRERPLQRLKLRMASMARMAQNLLLDGMLFPLQA